VILPVLYFIALIVIGGWYVVEAFNIRKDYRLAAFPYALEMRVMLGIALVVILLNVISILVVISGSSNYFGLGLVASLFVVIGAVFALMVRSWGVKRLREIDEQDRLNADSSSSV